MTVSSPASEREDFPALRGRATRPSLWLQRSPATRQPRVQVTTGHRRPRRDSSGIAQRNRESCKHRKRALFPNLTSPRADERRTARCRQPTSNYPCQPKIFTPVPARHCRGRVSRRVKPREYPFGCSVAGFHQNVPLCLLLAHSLGPASTSVPPFQTYLLIAPGKLGCCELHPTTQRAYPKAGRKPCENLESF